MFNRIIKNKCYSCRYIQDIRLYSEMVAKKPSPSGPSEALVAPIPKPVRGQLSQGEPAHEQRTGAPSSSQETLGPNSAKS